MKENPGNSNLLMIFARNPELGKVKTRVASGIGDEAALGLYKILLQRTFEVSTNLNCDKVVYYSEAVSKDDLWEKGNFQKKLQQGQDLGQRMKNAFKKAFSEGYLKVMIIGSDLYDLQEEDLKKAFLALDDNDFVIGPAQDGGYYLLGMKKMYSAVFQKKKWSTSEVLKRTLENLENEKVSLLEMRNDIDTVEDLQQHKELDKLVRNKKR